jgi:hypothetical protein
MTIGAYVEMEGKALRALKFNSDRWVPDSYKLFWKECTAFLRKHHIPTKVMTEQGRAPVTDPLLFPHSIVKPLQPSCYSRPVTAVLIHSLTEQSPWTKVSQSFFPPVFHRSLYPVV